MTGTSALAHGETNKLMLEFAAGPFNTKANDRDSPILTVTLTEVGGVVVSFCVRSVGGCGVYSVVRNAFFVHIHAITHRPINHRTTHTHTHTHHR